MTDNSNTSSADEITFADFLSIFVEGWKWILGLALAGLVASGTYLAISPAQYEASAMAKMAQSFRNSGLPNSMPNGIPIGIPNGNVEEPALLMQRLEVPATYTPAVYQACQVEKSRDPGETLVSLVRSSLLPDLRSEILIKVRHPDPEVAGQCLNAVFDLIRKQQAALLRPDEDILRSEIADLEGRLRKNHEEIVRLENKGQCEALYLMSKDESRTLLNELRLSLARMKPTRLVSDVYVIPRPVSPRPLPTLMVGTLVGLLLGSALSIGRNFYKRERPAR